MRAIRQLAVVVGSTGALALAPAAAQARSLYVPNDSGGSVSVIDTATNAVTSTITLAGEPYLAAVTPNGKTAYVVQYTGGLVPIPTSTRVPGTPIPISGADAPSDLAISPNGSEAYIANYYAGTLSRVHLSTGTPDTPINVGGSGSGTYAVTVSPDGKTAYVSNYGSGHVVPVNLTTASAETPIPVPAANFSAITPDGRTLWVVSNDDIVPINTSTHTGGTAISLPGASEPLGIALSPSGTMAYVTDYSNDEVFPVNLRTRSVGLPIPTGHEAYYLTLTPNGQTVYSANFGTDTVTPITAAANTAQMPITVGSEPGQMAVVPNQGPKAAFRAKVKGHRVSLNASKSSDSDGKVVHYAWSFGDGSKKTTSKPKVKHTYRHRGRYRVTLTVTDNEGCSNHLVFTGQTAYCNGTKAAVARHRVRTT